MYYIAVSSIGEISVGERLFLTEDTDFEEISAIRGDGEVVGYVVSFGIEGCLTKDFLSRFVSSSQGIVCDVAIKSGDIIILSSEGRYQNTTIPSATITSHHNTRGHQTVG